jgi:hypothetical protein
MLGFVRNINKIQNHTKINPQKSYTCRSLKLNCGVFLHVVTYNYLSHYIYFFYSNCILHPYGSSNYNTKPCKHTAGNRHKQNSWFCKEIREDNFRFWWRRVHEDASQGMYMSKIEIFLFTARILQNQRMLCCGECFHD